MSENKKSLGDILLDTLLKSRAGYAIGNSIAKLSKKSIFFGFVVFYIFFVTAFFFISVFGLNLKNPNINDWVNVAVFFNNALSPLLLGVTVILLFATWNTSQRELEATNKYLASQTSVVQFDKLTSLIPKVVADMEEWLMSPVDPKLHRRTTKATKKLSFYDALMKIYNDNDIHEDKKLLNRDVFVHLHYTVSKITSNPKNYAQVGYKTIYAHAMIRDEEFARQSRQHFLLFYDLLVSLDSFALSRVLYKDLYSSLSDDSPIYHFFSIGIEKFVNNQMSDDELSKLILLTSMSKVKGSFLDLEDEHIKESLKPM